MSGESKRNYNYKDAELTAICSFESKIASLNEVIEPKSETLELKLITQRLYASFHSLHAPIILISGYIRLAKLPITANDFGISAVRKSVYKKDAEGLVKNLNILIANTSKYQDELSVQGFNEDLITFLASTSASISADNQLQYEIISKRKSIAQNNLTLFNDIYIQLIEILSIGKILYKFSNKQKLEEYTLRKLITKVRMVEKEVPEAE